jgi:hypothetical protein
MTSLHSHLALFVFAVLALGVASACSSTPAPLTTAVAAPTAASAAPLVSDPDEYHDHGISAAAGESYFARLGGGDPYATGIAYPVWLALLESYPRELGGDVAGFTAAFGMTTDPAAPAGSLPLGFHLTTDPNTRVDFLVMNCQLCHAERLRLEGGDRLVSGLGSTRVRVHAYDAAITHVAHDPQLDTARIVAVATRIAGEHHLTWPDAVRVPIVRATIVGLRDRAESRGADVDRLASALPGRVATIESFAMVLNAHGAHIPIGDHIGWAKIPDVRGFPWRDTLSWDGVGTGSPVALAAEADFAFGARPQWFETHRHIATSLYMFLKKYDRDLPYPGAIDAALAKRGNDLFDATCTRCHGYYAPRGGSQPRVRYRERVIPVSVVGTDSTRVDAVTPAFIEAANAVPLAHGVSTVAPTGGYVPPVLLDVWARGTYGHAGQWPSIAVLATPPEQRPKHFVVDADARYDVAHMGLSWKPDATADGSRGTTYTFDSSAVGCGVEGHRFLSDLPAADRAAVVEYLKTL